MEFLQTQHRLAVGAQAGDESNRVSYIGARCRSGQLAIEVGGGVAGVGGENFPPLPRKYLIRAARIRYFLVRFFANDNARARRLLRIMRLMTTMRRDSITR
jgi:hypothetical protein